MKGAYRGRFQANHIGVLRYSLFRPNTCKYDMHCFHKSSRPTMYIYIRIHSYNILMYYTCMCHIQTYILRQPWILHSTLSGAFCMHVWELLAQVAGLSMVI